MQIDFASFPFHCATGELDINRALSIVSCLQVYCGIYACRFLELFFVRRYERDADFEIKRIDRAIFYGCVLRPFIPDYYYSIE